jgi:hypothetical protein
VSVDELSVDKKSVDELSVDGLSPHRFNLKSRNGADGECRQQLFPIVVAVNLDPMLYNFLRP